jgi:hypothetical protein
LHSRWKIQIEAWRLRRVGEVRSSLSHCLTLRPKRWLYRFKKISGGGKSEKRQRNEKDKKRQKKKEKKKKNNMFTVGFEPTLFRIAA